MAHITLSKAAELGRVAAHTGVSAEALAAMLKTLEVYGQAAAMAMESRSIRLLQIERGTV